MQPLGLGVVQHPAVFSGVYQRCRRLTDTSIVTYIVTSIYASPTKRVIAMVVYVGGQGKGGDQNLGSSYVRERSGTSPANTW